jgi:WD40 repeat protein
VPTSILAVGLIREETFSSAHPMIPFSKFGRLLLTPRDLGTYIWCANRDRRSLGSSPHPAGVLVGHTEGLTYVASKGDGRYVISNGKDQTLKLWDLRKMVSFPEWKEIRRDEYGIQDFDYR